MMFFFIYLLKANLVLALLYGFYYLCLRRDTFNGNIRWYLLVTVVATVSFPLIDVSGWMSGSEVAVSTTLPNASELYQLLLVMGNTSEVVATKTVLPRVNPEAILFYCLLAVTACLLAKRLFQLVSLMYMIHHSGVKRIDRQIIVEINADMQPFSFFRWIFLNPSHYTEEELDEVMAHERIHCRNMHSVDILLSEMVVCLCWFNPLAWMLRNDLRQNIEYYTDRKVLQLGFDRKHYQYHLLRVSANRYPIANHFQFNHLKKRIIMMNRKESPRIFFMKYLLVIPVLFAAMWVTQVFGSEYPVQERVADVVNEMIHATPDMAPDTSTHEQAGTPIISGGNLSNKIEQTTSFNIHAFDIAGRSIGQPLIIVDGKKLPITTLDMFDPNRIASISVLKYKAAVEIYGDEAQNGVIIVSLKNSLNISSKTGEDKTISDYRVRQGNNQFQENVDISALISAIDTAKKEKTGPLYVVDGKILDAIDHLSPSDVESISVLKSASAVSLYGDQARYGVILITTKKKE